jgi:hypothetical protein
MAIVDYSSVTLEVVRCGDPAMLFESAWIQAVPLPLTGPDPPILTLEPAVVVSPFLQRVTAMCSIQESARDEENTVIITWTDERVSFGQAVTRFPQG